MVPAAQAGGGRGQEIDAEEGHEEEGRPQEEHAKKGREDRSETGGWQGGAQDRQEPA